MTNFGFKKLTVDNWLKPDKISSSLIHISVDKLMRDILKHNLLENVPIEIRRLFEVARGVIVYGYVFYPLYTMGAERLFQVAEAGVTHKCKTMGAPKSMKTFQKKVEWLICNGIIPKAEERDWDAVRTLRNTASHPKDQSIALPGMIIGMLEHITEKINSLYK